MMAEPSLDAWAEIKKTLSERQNQVYKSIFLHPDRTTPEIAKIMILPVRSVAPRITELLKLGKIIRSDRRNCTVTGGSSYTMRSL